MNEGWDNFDHDTLPSAGDCAIVVHMSRDDKSPEEQVAETRAWKADLRSTPEGEAAYKEMCARAIEVAERLETRRSA